MLILRSISVSAKHSPLTSFESTKSLRTIKKIPKFFPKISKFQRKIRSKRRRRNKKKKIVKSNLSSLDKFAHRSKRQRGKIWKKYISPPSPLPYAEQRLQRVEARQSGRTRKHSGRETSLNKSALLEPPATNPRGNGHLALRLRTLGDPNVRLPTNVLRVHRLMHCLLFALRTNGRA